MKYIIEYDTYLNENIFTDIKDKIVNILVHLRTLAQEELSYNVDKRTEMIINSGFYKTLKPEHMKFLKNKIDNIDKLNDKNIHINESFLSSITKQTGLLAIIFGGLRYLNPILNFIVDTKEYVTSLMHNQGTLIQSINNTFNISLVQTGIISEVLWEIFIIFTVVSLFFFILDIIKHKK